MAGCFKVNISYSRTLGYKISDSLSPKGVSSQINNQLYQQIRYLPDIPSFMVVETDKRIYYPGETIEVAVFLRLPSPLYSVESLVINLKGKEYFKFTSKVKNHRSLNNKRLIVDHSVSICRFSPSELLPGDYAFMFKYKIPAIDTPSQQQNQNQQNPPPLMQAWPASFHMRRDIADRGELKMRTKYRVKAFVKMIGRTNTL